MATITFSRTYLRHGRKRGATPKADWDELVTLINSLKDLANELKTLYDGHKHSFDGSQTTNAISSTPVTGATTGTAAGGSASLTTVAAVNVMAID